MKKVIKIDDLIPFLNKGWVAMDEDKTWNWFLEKPIKLETIWIAEHTFYLSYASCLRKIKSVKDWKKSLRKVG